MGFLIDKHNVERKLCIDKNELFLEEGLVHCCMFINWNEALQMLLVVVSS